MGQTLTYGVYLPDEGERNCYSGLANNWQILDDAVGAIAGKANASHTHGNITNGGAIGSTSGLPIITGNDGVLTTGTFGNTAGTFCEGNDSRLSDARTPLAHTHTKSDVTDLLNSNFVPSANNTYDLGSTSYQWNNLYAKNVNTQSVNRVNPGALSLPNGNAQDSSWIGDLTIKDGSSYNFKTFTLNGWITINIPNTAGNLVVVNNGCGQIITNEANGIIGNNCAVFIPVVANVQVSILLVLQPGESVKTAIFAPCLGNV